MVTFIFGCGLSVGLIYVLTRITGPAPPHENLPSVDAAPMWWQFGRRSWGVFCVARTVIIYAIVCACVGGLALGVLDWAAGSAFRGSSTEVFLLGFGGGGFAFGGFVLAFARPRSVLAEGYRDLGAPVLECLKQLRRRA